MVEELPDRSHPLDAATSAHVSRRPTTALNYQSGSRGADGAVAAGAFAFWCSFYVLGLFVVFMAFGAIGSVTPAALLLYAASLLWALATFLQLRCNRFRYVVAAAALSAPWGSVFFVVAWTLWEIAAAVHAGRPLFDPDHPMGLPELLLFEVIVLACFTVPFLILLRYKPWRNGLSPKPIMATDGPEDPRAMA